MDSRSDHKNQTQLPPELQDQLKAFQKQLWQVKIAEAILAGFLGLFISYLLVFGLDRFIETPGIVRLVILVSGVSLFALFAPMMLRRWVWGHREKSQLARLIASKYPALGDRLLGAVELAKQDANSETLSPALRRAALENVSREAKAKDLEKALPASRKGRLAFATILLFSAVAMALLFMPDAGVNALKRWLMPLSDTPRYTFARLDNLPKTMIVPYGEAFPLDITLSASSATAPNEAKARFSGKDWLTSEKNSDGGYHFDLPGQQAITFLDVQVGDVIKKIRIEPLIRPSLESLTAVVTPPEYLRQKPRELEVRTGYLSAVEGSQVTLKGTTSRSLAQLTTGPPVGDDVNTIISDLNAPNGTLTSTPNSTEFSLPPLTLTKDSFDLPISWKDVHDLENRDQYTLTVESSEDVPPAAYAQNVPRQRLILEEETLEFEALAEDDWGLKNIGLIWQGQSTLPTDQSGVTGEIVLKDGGPNTRRITENVSFSPKAYGITPQKLTLRVYTSDYYPDRERVYSQEIQIQILTKDQHAQLIQNQFEQLLDKMDDIARIEQDNLDQNQRLEREDAEDLQKEEKQLLLAEQGAKEAENTQKMKELSKRMEELFKNALRNGDIDKESMKQLSETNQDIRELAEESLPKVQEKLNDSQSKQNTAEKTKKDLKEAVEEQKKAVEKMRETIDKANKAKERLEASTFVNRLKRAAADQDAVASAMLETGRRSVGLHISRVDPADIRSLSAASDQQVQAISDIGWIQEDLSSYYSRTQKEIHKTLYDAMVASRITRELANVNRNIKENTLFRSIGPAKAWAQQLRDWWWPIARRRRLRIHAPYHEDDPDRARHSSSHP